MNILTIETATGQFMGLFYATNPELEYFLKDGWHEIHGKPSVYIKDRFLMHIQKAESFEMLKTVLKD